MKVGKEEGEEYRGEDTGGRIKEKGKGIKKGERGNLCQMNIENGRAQGR